MDEQPRPVANADEQAYTLTVEDAAALYEAAGHARTMRAIQKYCFRGDLTAVREQTNYGERYRITPESVARHIEQIEQLSQTHRREQSRSDAAIRLPEIAEQPAKNEEASVREQSRPDANDDRYMAQLESENAFLRQQNDKKDQQLERRDRQIEAMIERDRETNIIMKELGERIPMLPGPARRGEEARTVTHADISDESAAEERG